MILEPVVGNAGCIALLRSRGTCMGSEELTRRDSALLIVDEVMTGFPRGAGRRLRAVLA